MLDCSPAKISEYSERYQYDFWQLRTPLTQYALSGKPYGLDNGCFAEFREKTWRRLLDEALENPPLWCCLPDIVGDARRTRELFDWYYEAVRPLPKAFVLQDGISGVDIPWRKISAVFVGGSDQFKASAEAMAACKAAKMIGKWVHVGRVNTPARVKYWLGVADSIDGSGISRFDHMLEAVLDAINGGERQADINFI